MIPNAGLRGTGDCFRSESSQSSCAGSSWGFQAHSRRHKRSRMALILKWDFQETSSILHFLFPALLENRSFQPSNRNHNQATPLHKFNTHAMELFLPDEKLPKRWWKRWGSSINPNNRISRWMRRNIIGFKISSLDVCICQAPFLSYLCFTATTKWENAPSIIVLLLCIMTTKLWLYLYNRKCPSYTITYSSNYNSSCQTTRLSIYERSLQRLVLFEMTDYFELSADHDPSRSIVLLKYIQKKQNNLLR